MQIELHLLDVRYEHLKVRNVREEKRLVGSVAQQGQVSPIVVVASSSDDGRYVVIDGFKRVRTARKLGNDTVEAAVWDSDEADALVTVHLMQRPRERSSLEDAYLVQALVDEHGLSQVEVGRRLGRTASWVSRRLALLKELPDWLQEQVQTGGVQCYAATKYLVPLARTNRDDAEGLARTIAGLGLSTREIGELYTAWQEGDEVGRELVVNNPGLVLEARRAAREPLEPSADAVDHLLQDVERIHSLLQRCRRHLDRLLLGPVDTDSIARLRRAWRRAETAASHFGKRLDTEVVDHVGPGETQSNSHAEIDGLRRAPDREDAQSLPCCGAQGPG